MLKLDSKDQELQTLLGDNEGIDVTKLSRRHSLYRAIVQNRIKPLEDKDVIIDDSVLIGQEAERPEVRALMSIETEGTKEASVISKLRETPNVTAVHHTAGRWDIIAEIHTNSQSDFNEMVEAFRLIEGVISTETNLLLNSYE